MDATEHSPIFATEQRDLLHVLAYLQLQHGKADKAALIFDALAADCPSDPLMALSHACALLRAGEPIDALAILDTLPAGDGDPTLAWLLRGQALSRLGRVAEAARAMRMFIRQRHADEAQGQAQWKR